MDTISKNNIKHQNFLVFFYVYETKNEILIETR